ncbi:oocyte zinc finger -like isoform X3 [Pelobates cultripes]|uniref:Oocyte zinc finger -like isoform X3 n=1 Tax=Pelobates cultripes TaxID=61616 RepID=A0AAD1WS03_PELCU|nr:oocyte zinc finger -like isoform X3 [Pelobates cultripes]
MMPNTNRNQMTEKFLDLTLEVNYLLTGENYIVVKKPAESTLQCNSPCVLDGSNRAQSPSRVPPHHSLLYERNNDQNILELTNQIIHLLTGEVWKYLEGHKEPYNDLMMDTHQPLSSLADLNLSETDDLPIHVLSANCVTEGEGTVNQGGNSMTFNDRSTKPSTSVRPEITLYEERNLSAGDIYSLKECSQTKSPSAFNVKESVSQNNRNFTDTDIITPTEQTPYPSTRIKDEPTSCREDNLTDTDSYTNTEQREYPSTYIKEESASCAKGNLTDTNIYTLTIETKYPSTHMKEEPALCAEGNHMDTEIYTNSEQTEYPSTCIKEESASCVEGNLTDTNIYTPTEQTQTECFAIHFKEDPASYEEGNLHNLDIQTPVCDPVRQSKGKNNNCDGPDVSLTNLNQIKVACSECGEKFTCKTNFIGHRCLQSKVHVIRCLKTCHGAKSRSRIEHEKHSQTKSLPKRHLIHNGEKLKRKYYCSECGKYFKKSSSLKFHWRSHTGEKPFSCSECGKCFSKKTTLIGHEWTHREQKPFSCSECGKCFGQRGNFNRHLKIHTGIKPFSCSECGKCFSLKSSLDRHVIIHTGVKPYSCSECGKCFTLKSTLDRHLVIHTGEKPFLCTECGKCFAQKSQLKSHQRVHNRSKPEMKNI